MDSANVDDIKKSVRTYILIFVTLMVLTVVTVSLSMLHLSVGAAIAIGLTVATIKGSLVVAYFMHLISERKIIYATLILTVFFFAVLMLVPVSWYLDRLVH